MPDLTLTPPEITAALLALGEKKTKQSYHVTFFKSWMAAWILCFGAMLVQFIQGGSGTLRTDYPSLTLLLASFFFPVGLIMLVLTGQDLCTANFMVVPMAALKGRVRMWEIGVNWLIVFFGNLAGALTYVAFLGHWSGLYNTQALITFSRSVAVSKTSQGWGECLLRGIGCNFLVCMAVLLGTGAREMVSKIAALHFPVMLFVFLGFEHVIVNMYYIPMGIMNGAEVGIGKYIGMSMIPSLLGNIIGALILGFPMVFFYQPMELPFFNRGSRHAQTESVIVREGEAGHGSGSSGASSPAFVGDAKNTSKVNH